MTTAPKKDFKTALAIKNNTDFVKGVNDDVKPINTTQTITTKNNSRITVENNTLSAKQRSRSKHGRNLITHFFVEELEALEETAEQLGESSVSNLVRQLVLDKCQSVLGEDKYLAITANKRNVIKSKNSL